MFYDTGLGLMIGKYDNNMLIIMTPRAYKEFMAKGKPRRRGLFSRWNS
jgi:hypothetical protein